MITSAVDVIPFFMQRSLAQSTAVVNHEKRQRNHGESKEAKVCFLHRNATEVRTPLRRLRCQVASEMKVKIGQLTVDSASTALQLLCNDFHAYEALATTLKVRQLWARAAESAEKVRDAVREAENEV